MEGGLAHAKMMLVLGLSLLLLRCNKEAATNSMPCCGMVALEDGDLVFRYGNGIYSHYFRDFSRREKKYSHVGIIYRNLSRDTIFVIHAEADERTGIGGVKKQTIETFSKGASAWAIYRLKASEKQRIKVAEVALQYYWTKVPFDLDFDAQDTTAFYCTELAAACVNWVLDNEVIRPSTIMGNKAFIAIDDVYLNKHMEWVSDSEHGAQPLK